MLTAKAGPSGGAAAGGGGKCVLGNVKIINAGE